MMQKSQSIRQIKSRAFFYGMPSLRGKRTGKTHDCDVLPPLALPPDLPPVILIESWLCCEEKGGYSKQVRGKADGA